LNALKNHFGEEHLEIIGLPSNNFGLQEPGGNANEIMNGITHVRPGNGYLPNFPLTRKVDVNGEKEIPLYKYLKRSCPSTRNVFSRTPSLYYSPLHQRDIKWNFEKFLIAPNTGRPYRRYDPSVQPSTLQEDIQHLLMVFKNLTPISKEASIVEVDSMKDSGESIIVPQAYSYGESPMPSPDAIASYVNPTIH
jgi:glutathione peroxidase